VIAAQVLWQHLFLPNGMTEHTTQSGSSTETCLHGEADEQTLICARATTLQESSFARPSGRPEGGTWMCRVPSLSLRSGKPAATA
jgi:hypothetical protein